MKLHRELVDRIASRVAATIDSEHLVAGLTRPALVDLLARAINDDLRVEDRLNDEVRDIIQQHMAEMDRANVEHHEMFKKIKAKLVRDRNLIL